MITDVPGQTITRAPEVHNHPPSGNFERDVIANSVKRKALDDMSGRPAKMVRKEIVFSSPAIRENLTRTDVLQCRRRIVEQRRAQFPALPKTMNETISRFDWMVENSKAVTVDNENMILINDHQHKIVVFGTVEALRFLCEMETIYMDGTFDYCVAHFAQLFTIHGVRNNNYVPLLFCLLPNKEASSYKKLFQLIVGKCWELTQLVFFANKVVVDFEAGIHVALKSTWPGIKIQGCLFHLTQAWYRKIQELGLVRQYRDQQSPIGIWLRWSLGLPFLNEREVAAAFRIMEPYGSIFPQLERYCRYLKRVYIEDAAIFPPKIWATDIVWNTETTNVCESFHSHYNNSFTSAHPNIYKFLAVLRGYFVDAQINMRSAHIPNNVLNRKSIRKKQTIQQFRMEYENGQRHLFDYVFNVSKYYKK